MGNEMERRHKLSLVGVRLGTYIGSDVTEPRGTQYSEFVPSRQFRELIGPVKYGYDLALWYCAEKNDVRVYFFKSWQNQYPEEASRSMTRRWKMSDLLKRLEV